MSTLSPVLGLDTNAFDPRAIEAAEKFVETSRRLGDRSFWPLRIFTNAELFLWHLDAFDRPDDPVPLFVEAFDRARHFLENAAGSRLTAAAFPPRNPDDADPDEATGPIFGDIYSPITDEEYFGEALRTLESRLTLNGIDPHVLFKDKRVVDAGCGAGKYGAAMVRFGAAHVTGVDITVGGLEKARRQSSKFPEGARMEFRQGSVTDLPVEDGVADLAWCNSVLHLVDDPLKGLKELNRVLKPGGKAFIYVNGSFGLLEILVRALYAANQDLPRSLFQHALAATGMNPGRVAWVVGFTFANYRFMPRAWVEEMIAEAGFEVVTKLERGLPIDQCEAVAAGAPYASVKYGEAKLNYLMSKVR